jgi:hypothetical protein
MGDFLFGGARGSTARDGASPSDICRNRCATELFRDVPMLPKKVALGGRWSFGEPDEMTDKVPAHNANSHKRPYGGAASR